MEAKEMKKKFKEVRKETKKATPYMTWNNKNFGEGTMSQGIFDKDIERAKDSARNLVMFLKSNQDVTVGSKEDKEGNRKKETRKKKKKTITKEKTKNKKQKREKRKTKKC